MLSCSALNELNDNRITTVASKTEAISDYIVWTITVDASE